MSFLLQRVIASPGIFRAKSGFAWQGFKTLPEKFQTQEKYLRDGAEYSRLIENNKNWVQKRLAEDPQYFARNVMQQNPKYLWIGCSDSRVPAESLTGLGSGEIFVHRNVANLVVNTDINLLSVLCYAIRNLKVHHVVVCGHYGCGGVNASCQPNMNLGVIEHWLRNIKDVQRLHCDELAAIEDPEEQQRRLVELNVAEQCINLHKTGVVQEARTNTGYPLIHGMVFDIRNGQLRKLDDSSYSFMQKYKYIYNQI